MDNCSLSASLKRHSGVIQSLTVYKQDSKKHIASGCDKGVIKLWDLEANQLITTLGQGHTQGV
jgi:WD40 repeat protein